MNAFRPSRRSFLSCASAVALSALSYRQVLGANDKLRVASVGVGGKGWDDLVHVAASPSVAIVGLCDIDESGDFLGRAAEKFRSAQRTTDWRKLLDKASEFDAVIVSTPDHMHAPVALPAMQLRKHVFCQKPLTHTVYEARQMRLAAKKFGVVTQMGNQIQSHEAYRTAVKAVHDGVVGMVKAVHSWQAGKMGWMLADDRPAGADPVPATVHWDEWIGVAPTRPYKARLYHSFNWRAWQDFSNGQLGDFGCHILDPVFMACKLTAPTSIRAEATPMNKEVWYKASTVHYVFPGNDLTAGPTVPVTWYDGDGKVPAKAALGLAETTPLPGSGSIIIGEKRSLIIPHVAMPSVIVDGKPAPDVKLEKVASVDHYVGWADACRGVGRTTSHFDYAAPLTETVLLGTVAIRTPGETLNWDSAALNVTNSPKATALLKKPYRAGWEPTWIA